MYFPMAKDCPSFCVLLLLYSLSFLLFSCLSLILTDDDLAVLAVNLIILNNFLDFYFWQLIIYYHLNQGRNATEFLFNKLYTRFLVSNSAAIISKHNWMWNNINTRCIQIPSELKKKLYPTTATMSVNFYWMCKVKFSQSKCYLYLYSWLKKYFYV